MKNTAAALIFFIASNLAIAQDATECEKIVLQTYEAINTKNAEPLLKYLSDDFSIAGQTGEIAKLVLPQLFSQLNMEVSNIEKVSETKTDVLTLVYEADFGDKGRKSSTFVFNPNNQLKSLELLPMQVMSKKGNVEVEKDTQAYFTMPFKRVGNLLTLQAKLNGVDRTFLLDNGAPILLLNSAYTAQDTTDKKIALSAAKGAGGTISDMGIEKIESFEFGGISLATEELVSTDLSHLEQQRNATFYGLIGYEIYKDYDLLFDYKKKTVTFIKPEATAAFLENEYKSKKQVEVRLEMEGHIAVVDGFINGKKYALGLDCGAESSLLDATLEEELKSNLRKTRTDTLTGADKNKVGVTSGRLNSIVIGGVNFKKTEAVFSDISHLNEGYSIKLDGLIGYDILSNQPTLMSYVNKKVIFLE